MLGSKNDFFHQSTYDLIKVRSQVSLVLSIKSRSQEDLKEYLQAYDYFIKNPDAYDGATIVKDLVDIRNGSHYLDLDAMVHDYQYVVLGANKNFYKKWKSDLKYIKNMELNGKGIRVFRFILLTVIGLVFVPYKILKQ